MARARASTRAAACCCTAARLPPPKPVFCEGAGLRGVACGGTVGTSSCAVWRWAAEIPDQRAGSFRQPSCVTKAPHLHPSHAERSGSCGVEPKQTCRRRRRGGVARRKAALRARCLRCHTCQQHAHKGLPHSTPLATKCNPRLPVPSVSRPAFLCLWRSAAAIEPQPCCPPAPDIAARMRGARCCAVAGFLGCSTMPS
jgi:hypothetical protein